VRLSLLVACMAVVALVSAPASTGAAPLGWFGPILPDSTGGSGENARSVACPSAKQCTAVDNQGQQVTFDPSSPGDPTPTSIDPGNAPDGIACPSTTQCAAVDNEGQLVTFDPNSPGSPTAIKLSSDSLESIACPLEDRCTAVGNPTSNVVTFNPLVPEDPAISPLDPNNGLVAVACPSSTQCTAVDPLGQEVTFNPIAPGNSMPVSIDPGNRLEGLACPSTNQCTAVDDKGQQVTFDPTAPGSATPAVVVAGDWLWGVACPSMSQCTAVGESGEATFDPTKAESQTLATIGVGSAPKSVACPSVEQCTAVWGSEEVTFNPIEPPTPSTATTAPMPPAYSGKLPTDPTRCATVPRSAQRLRFRGQRITVTIPHQHDCGANGGQLDVALSSVLVERKNAGELALSSATFSLDGGLEHAHMSTVTVKDHKATVGAASYRPNAGVDRISAAVQPPLAGMGLGMHLLTIKLYYRVRATRGHSSSAKITRTITTKFRVD
jgi:hypothetical protein